MVNKIYLNYIKNCDIKKDYKFKFFNKKYVLYPRGNPNKYNDIYIYLKKGTTPKYIDEIEFAKKDRKKEINLEKW